jgi:putative FmdB family regulatory protein
LPIYEYRCNDCGYEFEAMQKFSDSPISTCSKCSSGVTKLISQSAFHLKGTGWYATDYARKSVSENSKDEKEIKKEIKDVDSKPREDNKD